MQDTGEEDTKRRERKRLRARQRERPYREARGEKGEVNVEIELLGYKGRITHITFKQKLEPWHPEDTLLAIIEFDEPCPGSTLSMGISIPVKDYSREELLEAVREHGEDQLKSSLAEYRQQAEEHKKERERGKELAALAQNIEARFSG